LVKVLRVIADCSGQLGVVHVRIRPLGREPLRLW
jgi:hypothetical protein